jgi:hypothetical protein
MRNMFFSEEKNQETFVSRADGTIRDLGGTPGSRGDVEVFWFFSSEKNAFLLLP